MQQLVRATHRILDQAELAAAAITPTNVVGSGRGQQQADAAKEHGQHRQPADAPRPIQHDHPM